MVARARPVSPAPAGGDAGPLAADSPHSPDSPTAGRSSWVGRLAALAGIIAATALMSAVFWPGHMNDDTIGELWSARLAHYTDWHTALYSAMWRLAIVAGLRSPGWALATGLLVLLMGLYLLLRARLSRPWALASAVLVAVYPPVLGVDVIIGTDGWFASSMLCGFGLVALTARTRGWSRAASAVLAIVFAFLAQAARPTAGPAVLALFCSLALVTVAGQLRGGRRALATGACGIAAASLVFVANLGVQRLVLHADEVHPEQATYKFDLVAMSVRERRVLLPLDVYPRQDLSYLAEFSGSPNVLDISPLLWGSHAAIPPLVQGKKLDSLQRAWLATIRQYPYDYLRMRLHTAMWQLTISGPASVVYYQAPLQYGLRPPFPGLHSVGMAYTAIGSAPDATGGPLQRVWIYVLVLLAFVAASVRRRRAIDAVLGPLSAALLCYTAGILLFSPIVTYRYMYPAVVTGTVLFIVLVADVGHRLGSRARARRPAGARPTR